ncbi:MAG: Ig-like domain-containing protein, partial [Spirochaetia bacterium]|nr:Ig-like domain-containing protein [Spirochaetia bacterium]
MNLAQNEFRKDMTVFKILLVIVSVIFLNCSKETAKKDDISQIDITLSGSVSNGPALAGKTVTIKSADGQLIGEAVTNADGSYSIDIPENTVRPLIVTANVDANTNLNSTVLKGSLDFSSFMAGLIYKETSTLTNLTVNINPMTDHVNKKLLGDNLENLSSVEDGDFNAQADEIIQNTMGSTVAYSSFSDDPEFQSPNESQEQPSAAGMVLDTLVARANNENPGLSNAFSNLLDNHGSVLNCNGQIPPPFLNEDQFQVALASNYMQNGFTTEETSESISELTGGDAAVLAALDELTAIINEFVVYAVNAGLNADELKTALDALTETVLAIIEDTICETPGANSITDISANALGNLTANTINIVDDAIINTVNTTTLTGESEEELLSLISTQTAAILDNEDLTTEVIADTTELETTVTSTASTIVTVVEETGDTDLTTITDAQAVSLDAASVVIYFSGSDSINSVTQNIFLPIDGYNGSTITWAATSGDTSLVSINNSSGTINQPYDSSRNPTTGTVTLTATITKNGVSELKTFTLTIIGTYCGDSLTQAANEACDDGNTVDTDACLSTCEFASCGDGFIQAGVEACDDGNTITESCAYGETSCMVCDASCNSVAGAVTGYCGDGTINGTESCDDGNTVDDGNGCDASCQTNNVCGDSILQSLYEACDDGNTITESCAYGETSCTVCDASCNSVAGAVSGYCGDGTMNGTESCDDGNTVDDGNGCDASCQTNNVCGDSILQSLYEACDDGNTITES